MAGSQENCRQHREWPAARDRKSVNNRGGGGGGGGVSSCTNGRTGFMAEIGLLENNNTKDKYEKAGFAKYRTFRRKKNSPEKYPVQHIDKSNQYPLPQP
ncbi:unnamed protein product [Dicrocoelium dendriticum]|nr:unnamed protein product [Dicrocoelium dendriticum]